MTLPISAAIAAAALALGSGSERFEPSASPASPASPVSPVSTVMPPRLMVFVLMVAALTFVVRSLGALFQVGVAAVGAWYLWTSPATGRYVTTAAKKITDSFPAVV